MLKFGHHFNNPFIGFIASLLGGFDIKKQELYAKNKINKTNKSRF